MSIGSIQMNVTAANMKGKIGGAKGILKPLKKSIKRRSISVEPSVRKLGVRTLIGKSGSGRHGGGGSSK